MNHRSLRLAAASSALTVGVVLFPLAASVHAADLTGVVTDSETGETLGFASVQVEGSAYRGGALAAADGAFVLRFLPPGIYVVRISFIGYRPFEGNVTLTNEAPAELTVGLVQEAIPMETVEITADPLAREREVQTGLVTLDRETIQAIPAFGETDPIRSLQLLPGVQAASDISSGLYVRGGGPDQTLILLDEVPIYNPTHAFGLFSTFNSDLIDQVKLYKGAYPAEYGGRLGAVLDVRNRNGGGAEVSGRGAVSTITGRMMLEGPVGKGSWLVSGRRTYLEPILNALRSADNEIPSYYFYDLNANLTMPGPGTDQYLMRGYLGQDDLFFDLDKDSFIDIRWGNRSVSAKYRHFFAPTVLGSLLLSGTEYESTTEVKFFTTPATFRNRLRDVTARGDLVWEMGESHRLRTGLTAAQYDFEFDQSFNFEDQVVFNAKPLDVSVYAEDEWSFAPDAIARAGVRGRYFSEGERYLLEPRLSLSLKVAEAVRAKLGGGLYHQYLQLVTTEGFSGGDFYLPIDETAEPGRSWQTVAGLEWSPSRQYALSVEGYWTDLSNLVALDNRQAADNNGTETETIFLTGGTGYATGAEIFAQRRLGQVTGWVGYTLGWTRRKFADRNAGLEYAPKYDRRHDLNVVVNYDRGRWDWGASFIYATGQAFTPATARYSIRNPATGVRDEGGLILPGLRNSARLLPYHRLDLSVTREFELFGRDAKWILQVFNAYNRRNEWFVQHDTENAELDIQVVKMLPIIPSLGLQWDL